MVRSTGIYYFAVAPACLHIKKWDAGGIHRVVSVMAAGKCFAVGRTILDSRAGAIPLQNYPSRARLYIRLRPRRAKHLLWGQAVAILREGGLVPMRWWAYSLL